MKCLFISSVYIFIRRWFTMIYYDFFYWFMVFSLRFLVVKDPKLETRNLKLFYLWAFPCVSLNSRGCFMYLLFYVHCSKKFIVIQLSFSCHSVVIQLSFSCHSVVIQLSFIVIQLSFSCHSVVIQLSFSCHSLSFNCLLFKEKIFR